MVLSYQDLAIALRLLPVALGWIEAIISLRDQAPFSDQQATICSVKLFSRVLSRKDILHIMIPRIIGSSDPDTFGLIEGRYGHWLISFLLKALLLS